jgi:C-terminal processing protease CtpA/Prc
MTIYFITNYSYKFKATYEVRRVAKNSVANKAGLKAGDIVLAINRKLLYNNALSNIINKLQERENKKNTNYY